MVHSKADLERRLAAKRSQLATRRHLCLCQGRQVAPTREASLALEGLGAEGLVDKIRQGEITAEEVVYTFIARSRALGYLETNSIMEEMYDKAMEAARALDRRIQQQDPSLSSMTLLGVPISIKDQLDVAGSDSTCGLAVRCMEPKDHDALVVECLKDAGAIIHVKTNVPQAVMLPETTNHIIGTTYNPWNLERTPGGSSGGEAAMVALRASVIGIGTDIGGSVRTPSHFTGICCIRPTPWRTSDRGMAMPMYKDRYGQTLVKATSGAMALSVHDLSLVLRAWWVEKMWRRDAMVPPVPFNQSLYESGGALGRQLRVGYFTTDNWFQPCRTGVRAVVEARQALERAGCELVPITPPHNMDGWEVARLYYSVLSADGDFHAFFRGLEGEDWMSLFKTILATTSIPNFLRPLVRAVLWLLGEKRLHLLFGVGRKGGISAREYWELASDIHEYQLAYLGLMDEKRLDAIMCPALGLPAFRHGDGPKLESCCTYAFIANLLHFPAGCVPITTVRPEEATYPLKDLPPCQRDSIAACTAQGLASATGLPMGVQVLARPFQDEVVLHVMRLLEGQVHFTAMPELAKRLVAGLPPDAFMVKQREAPGLLTATAAKTHRPCGPAHS